MKGLGRSMDPVERAAAVAALFLGLQTLVLFGVGLSVLS